MRRIDISSSATAPSFGTLLRLHRRRLGLTQEALGERAGFSVEYIKKLEGGSRHPSAASLEVFAHALELDPADVEPFRAARIGAVPEPAVVTLVSGPMVRQLGRFANPLEIA